MARIYTSIVHDHDIRLVIVALAICLVATVTTFATLEHARRGGRREAAWIALAGFVSAIGIWSTHFVAMLAYSPHIPIRYNLDTTLLSVLAAVFIGGAGWSTFVRNRGGGPVAAGALIGTAIGTMHYLGMAAVNMAGHIQWDWGLVAVSLFVGVALSIAAVADYRRRPQFLAWRPAALFALAIVGLHFTAMAAAALHSDSTKVAAAEAIDHRALAVIIAGATLLILVISLLTVLIQRKLVRLKVEEALRVKVMEDAVRAGDLKREQLSGELKQQADISSAALNNMAQGLSIYDEQDRLVIFNRRYADLYKMPQNLLAPGTAFRDVLAFHIANGSLHRDNLKQYLADARRPGHVPGDSQIELCDGRIIDIQRRPLPNGGWVATHEDVTRQRRAAERSEYLATHDHLTGLPNRVSFAERLDLALAGLGGGSLHALLLVDLDRFKEVNDSFGHPVGDELLKQVAVRLREVAGEDSVSRLAGDEFAVIQRSVRQADDAGDLAGRIIAILSRPFDIDGRTVTIGASIGIALAPRDSSDPADLLRKGDLALYWAKYVGRGGFSFYTPRMDRRLKERRQLGNDLRIAVQKGQFELYYQPLLNLSSRRISGFEALVRWHHPRHGMLQSNDFIPVAEESGLIVQIGEWVLRQACVEAAKWPKPVSVSVNLSAVQFKRGNLLAMTQSALKAAGLEPGRLELEITESVLLDDESWVRRILNKLRELGVRIAMDDFGTGYSGLSYLRSFPFTKIKIDRSFVSDITVTRDALAIVQATIQLSEKLGIATTAEGIETADQLAKLADEGCTEGQGFHISRPVRASEIQGLIRRYGRHVEVPSLRVASSR